MAQVRLSVATSSQLCSHLTAIKRKLGLTLIKFQDAAVELEPFVRRHVFENSQFLLNSIIKHYKDVRHILVFSIKILFLLNLCSVVMCFKINYLKNELKFIKMIFAIPIFFMNEAFCCQSHHQTKSN